MAAHASAVTDDAENLPGPALGASTDPILQRAYAEFTSHKPALEPLIARTRQALEHYDAWGIDRAVTVCFWGRSGSLLFQSFLDGHPQILTLPGTLSQSIYPFLTRHASLSLWDKLLAFPTYATEQEREYASFLEGRYGVSPQHYYAAVCALYLEFRDRELPRQEERRRFVQLVHVAHALAAQRQLTTSRPLIVCAQHWPDDARAGAFIEDFPRGKFLHTIRDPISAFDSWYDRSVSMQLYALEQRKLAPRYVGWISAFYLDPAGQAARQLLRSDAAHSGMQERTRAVRFEDLHLNTEATMRRVAQWLEVEYAPSLLESTFNGVPFVWEAEGRSWVGTNPGNAVRRSRNLSRLDCLLIFALMHRNFREWCYPTPLRSSGTWMRLLLIALLAIKPTRPEVLNARLVVKRQIAPQLRSAHLGLAFAAPAYFALRRGVMFLFIALQAKSRLGHARAPMKVV